MTTLQNDSGIATAKRVGLYCSYDEFTFLKALVTGIPDFSPLTVILAGQASLGDPSSSALLSVRRAVDIVGTPVTFPDGVKYLEAKWVFVNQTDSAIIFYESAAHHASSEAYSYVTSYSRRLIERGDGSLVIVASQPDQLRSRLMAACKELELSRLKHLLDMRTLSIVQELSSDSLRSICGIR